MHVATEELDRICFTFREDSLYDDSVESDKKGAASALVDVSSQPQTDAQRQLTTYKANIARELTGPQICEAPNCSKDAPLRCARCGSSWYCSLKCQKAAWPRHKNQCSKPHDDKKRKPAMRLKQKPPKPPMEHISQWDSANLPDLSSNMPDVPEEDIVIQADCRPIYASRFDDDDE